MSTQAKLLNAMVYCFAALTKSWSYSDLIKHRTTIEKLAKLTNLKKSRTFKLEHLLAEWFYFPDACDKVILYLHGGAFIFGSTNIYRGILTKIAKFSHCRVLGIDYRLAPEYPFPTGLEDCILAYKWLLQQKIPANNIIIAGDSAGGNLALASALLLRDSDMPLPAAIAILSPWLDLTLSGASIMTHVKTDPLLRKELIAQVVQGYLPNQNAELPLASPLFADLSFLPLLYIQVSNTEVLYSDAVRLADKARIAGVKVELQVYQQMMHGWQFAHGWIPEAKQVIQDLAQFILNKVFATD